MLSNKEHKTRTARYYPRKYIIFLLARSRSFTFILHHNYRHHNNFYYCFVSLPRNVIVLTIHAKKFIIPEYFLGVIYWIGAKVLK